VVEELRRRGHVVLEEERTGYAHHATFGKAQVRDKAPQWAAFFVFSLTRRTDMDIVCLSQ